LTVSGAAPECPAEGYKPITMDKHTPKKRGRKPDPTSANKIRLAKRKPRRAFSSIIRLCASDWVSQVGAERKEDGAIHTAFMEGTFGSRTGCFNPFVPVGIAAGTMHFLDVFLLHCLLAESPPDTPEEIAGLARNQHRAAARGSEPGLRRERNGIEMALTEWGAEVIEECAPIAAALDVTHGGKRYDAVRTLPAEIPVGRTPHDLNGVRCRAATIPHSGSGGLSAAQAIDQTLTDLRSPS